jgi:alcohol dehydrogenase
MLEMIIAGRIDPRRLVGEEIALEDAPLALAQMDKATSAGISVITRL